MRFREEVVAKIAAANATSRQTGWCRGWFGEADDALGGVASSCNGRLLEQLLEGSRYVDGDARSSCVQVRPARTFFSRPVVLFFVGAEMLDELECSGVGEPLPRADLRSPGELWRKLGDRNRKMVRSLREDVDAGELLRLTREDARCGKMTEPVPVDEFDTDGVPLQPRFAVAAQARRVDKDATR